MLRRLALGLAASAGLLLACGARAAPTPEAQAYFDHALELLRTRHINSAEADWLAIEADARSAIANAQTTQDTYQAIRLVIERLGERHTFLSEQRPPAGASSPRQESSAPPEVPMPVSRLLDGGIGFVALPTLNTVMGAPGVGEQYRTVLREDLRKIDESARCGWIVDLRNNGGGNMWPMLQGLDPLLGEGPFGRFVFATGDVMWRRTAANSIFPMPGDVDEGAPAFTLEHADAPLAVLIGPQTASSGEMVAIAFVGRDDVRTFGAPSAGFTTANTPVPLGDGAVLSITVSKVGDRAGRVYEGAMVPDEETGVEDARTAAIAWLTERCAA